MPPIENSGRRSVTFVNRNGKRSDDGGSDACTGISNGGTSARLTSQASCDVRS